MKRESSDKARFEWNDKKDLENRRKHGVSFVLAQAVFFDPDRVIAEDTKHGKSEDRFYCIGKTDDGILTVRFTYRGKLIRIIGAGYWRKGKELYENKNKKKS